MKCFEKPSVYWNPYLETLNPKQLEDLQYKRFKEILGFAYNNSPAYRDLYESVGITPDSIRCFDDIKRVPVIDKNFFDDRFPLNSFYGNSLAVPEQDVVFFHQTSGTTHTPLRQPDTIEDWYWWAECWAALLWAQGVRETDRVLIAFNYNLFIGFWGAHYGCEKVGAEIISAGGLSTQQRLEKITELGVTAVITTPTYAFRLLEAAREKEIDMRSGPVKRIICAGEPGALIPSTKNELETQWNCDVFDHVGATEVGAWGFECSQKPGGLHVNESMFLTELLDFDSHEAITGPDKYGYLVITAFNRKGRPCIRFNTNDIGCWQESACPCGRTYRLLKGGVQGRIDHLIKARGTFVTPAAIENIINDEKKLGREYLIKIGEKSKTLDLIVETASELDVSEYQSVKNDLEEKIYNKTFLHFNITLKPNGELPRNELKSKRVIDLRKDR